MRISSLANWFTDGTDLEDALDTFEMSNVAEKEPRIRFDDDHQVLSDDF